MTSFATELASDIRREPAFWTDLASLRAVGVRATLLPEIPRDLPAVWQHTDGPDLVDYALLRLLNSASIFAQAADESSRDLAQQIAVFASLISNEAGIHDAAAHVLTGLGNFPGLAKLQGTNSQDFGLQPRIRNALLRELNSVEMAGKQIALTEFQLEVWKSLQTGASTAISAPTSAGKSFVVMEYLCENAVATDHFTALYIAPTRALLAEIQGKLG